jgi:hypothetical protein
MSAESSRAARGRDGAPSRDRVGRAQARTAAHERLTAAQTANGRAAKECLQWRLDEARVRTMVASPSAPAARAPHSGWRFLIAVGAVLVFAAWCWRGILSVSFTGEDLTLIQQQARGFELTPTVFRPLWHLWFWCGESLFGAVDPRPWHAAQLGLHLANAALVAAIARALRMAVLPSLAAAALFALGPGTADSLCWIAATNRQLAAFGALTCVLGLARFDHGPRWAWLALAGFLVQYGSNEEVYGTALFASGCLVWLALKPTRPKSKRLLLAALLPLALLAVHYLFLRGSGGSYLTRDGRFAELVFVQAPTNALARLREIAGGWCAGADEYDLIGVVVFGASLSWMKAERQRACFVVGALLASFVPFALEAGSHYRDYPTQAPAALALALLVDSLLLYVPVDPPSARRVPAALALLVACAAGWRERAAALVAWRDATAELEACRAPLVELARTPGARPPLLVNLETGTRALLLAFDGVTPEALLVQPGLAFLDTPHACAPPPELDALAAQPAGAWGRRADGSYGAIDAAQLLARPRVEPWKLYADVRVCSSLDEARARLASGELDPRTTALIEAPLGTLDTQPAAELASGDSLRIVQPLVLDAAHLQATIELELVCTTARWLVAQPPFLYSEAFRFGPEYARLGRVVDPRVVLLEARLDPANEGGQALAALRAQAFGFALQVPAGTQRVALRFAVRPAPLLAR